MTGLNRKAQNFLREYAQDRAKFSSAADFARKTIEEIARETGSLVHVVSGRAKTLASLRGKFRRKSYKNPARELTDLIGVRIITYYGDEVDTIVTRLREKLVINAANSVDKRLGLGLQQFGYRSVHLIARLKPGPAFSEDQRFLQQHWFEIQVRSILEHAWAEIEHEVVYKSGILQPKASLRRFASIAGAIELLDTEFLALREERNALIDAYAKHYQEKKFDRHAFDVARLLGFLEATRPGLSWRQAKDDDVPFGPGLESSCVEALRAAGLGTPVSLHKMFHSNRFRYILHTFAALQGIGVDKVSHLAAVVLALVVKDPRIVNHHFPEMMFDPAITSIVEKRVKRKR
jgi:ppGpp synthetase/RelA/SpoT-type nucleotidyltranferase